MPVQANTLVEGGRGEGEGLALSSPPPPLPLDNLRFFLGTTKPHRHTDTQTHSHTDTQTHTHTHTHTNVLSLHFDITVAWIVACYSQCHLQGCEQHSHGFKGNQLVPIRAGPFTLSHGALQPRLLHHVLSGGRRYRSPNQCHHGHRLPTCALICSLQE